MAKPNRSRSTPPKPTAPPAATTPSPKRPQVASQPQFLSIADAAKRLGVSEKTVRRAIDAGRIAAVRIGSQIRIPVAAFLHFIGTLSPARP